MKKYLLLAIVLTAGLFTGCATHKSKRARPLESVTGEPLDLQRFDTITVLSFTNLSSNAKGTTAGEQLATNVAERLRRDFPSVFTAIRTNSPLGQTNEVILTGTITTYRAGSRTARALVVGLGSAGLEGTVVFKDGATGKELMSAKFDKLWAWGGIPGASKGISDMMSETTASIAATTAQAKGWKPK